MKNILTVIIMIASMSSYAQSFREVFTEANLLTEDGYYGLAIPLWETLLAEQPNNANINYKIGKCYLNQGIDRNLAKPYLINASKDVRKNYDPFIADFKGAPTDTYYYLALAYHITSELDKAEEAYQQFIDQSSSKHFLKDNAQRGLNEIKTARELMSAPLDVNITNLGGPINTEFAEYSPIVAMDESTIYFTSRRLRPDSTNERKVEASTGLYYEDMYVSYRNINGRWMNPELLNINIPGEHSSVVSMGKNGKKIYIYRIFNGNGNIYESDFILGTGWSIPSLVGSDINTSHNEYFAALSIDENRLYFVSDRPGGLGGKDIWYANKLPNGEWGKSINLGKPINTPQDEDAPFIHPDGKTIYFSSNGHNTMGGYDIFYSKLGTDEKWSEPTNMGYPINTTDNDHSFITTPSGKRGYYSSRGSGSLGSTDIYIVDFKPDEKNAPEVDMSAFAVLKGFIYDPGKGEIPDDLIITIANNATNEVVANAKPVKRNGSYIFIVPSGNTYSVDYTLNNKELYSEVITIPEGVKYQEIKREIFINSDPELSQKVVALNESVLGNVMKWKIKLFGDSNTITVGSRILYLDGKGNVLDTVYVSKDGFFEYKKLASDMVLKPLIEVEDGTPISISLIENEKVVMDMIHMNGVYYEKGKEPQLEISAPSVAMDESEKGEDNDTESPQNQKKFLKTRAELKAQKATENQRLTNNTKHKSSITIYLGFNQTEIPVNEPDFTAAASDLIYYMKQGKDISIELIASASHLPTSQFPDNQTLADERLKMFEAAIRVALRDAGLDMNKISTINRKSLVSGPSYSQNTSNIKSDFIEFQYVRLTIH